MRIINYAIIGSGMSSFIVSLKIKNPTIFAKNSKLLNLFKSYNFYEYNNLGGNSNIWGGYINLGRLNYLLKKNKKFFNFFFKNEFFDTFKISNSKYFRNVGYLKNKKNNKILRLNKSFFNNFINFNLDRIKITKNYIELYSKNKIVRVKKVNFCIGNLGLIKVLKNSSLLNNNDLISYEDGKVNYFLNFFLNFEKYYYIPMSIKQIFEKFFFKSYIYNLKDNNNNLFVQAFSKNYSVYKYSVKELLSYENISHRGLITNHIANLRVNNIPLQKYMTKKSKKILINCSGTCPKYIPGSISQDIIYNAYINS